MYGSFVHCKKVNVCFKDIAKSIIFERRKISNLIFTTTVSLTFSAIRFLYIVKTLSVRLQKKILYALQALINWE